MDVLETTVYGEPGKLESVGGLLLVKLTPSNTMFQLPPDQPILELRVSHCCWLPEETVPSTLESAMKPPLVYPPLCERSTPFVTCTRRKAHPCDVTHSRFP